MDNLKIAIMHQNLQKKMVGETKETPAPKIEKSNAVKDALGGLFAGGALKYP